MMSRFFYLLIICSLLLSSASYGSNCNDLYLEAVKILKNDKTHAHNAVDFHKLTPAHFEAYFDQELVNAKSRLLKIIENKEAPTFKNTVEAIELLESELNLVAYPAFQLKGSMNSQEIQALTLKMSKGFTELNSQIMFNQKLFEKVEMVLKGEEYISLSRQEKQVVTKWHQEFINGGLSLPESLQARLVAIQNEGDQLAQTFLSNISKSKMESFVHITNKAELKGLSPDEIKQCEGNAKKRGLKGYVIEAVGTSASHFLKVAKESHTREKIYRLINQVATHGEFDNEPVIMGLLKLRQEYASILGYEDYARFSASQKMAKTKENIFDHLNIIIDRTKKAKEVGNQNFKNYLALKGLNYSELKPWDLSYHYRSYSEKALDLTNDQTRPYFELENTLSGIMGLTKKLYNVEFIKTKLPTYQDDVMTYIVKDLSTGEDVGLFYLDLYSRPEKRAGAWMTSIRPQSEGVKPHIVNVLNVSKPLPGEPTLLTVSEVNTILHELGHGLHGLFSKVPYSSMAGTSVVRDFVEAPSTFMEYFLRQDWFLESFAKHYVTGEKIPTELIQKIIASRTFESAASELGIARYSMMDMVLHTKEHENIASLREFEDLMFERTPEQALKNESYRLYVFTHLFSGFHSGYSAGYYVYRWAENYAANAFMIFMKEEFSPEVAERWRKYVLSVGGFGDAVKNYLKFSEGAQPDPEAFFKINNIN